MELDVIVQGDCLEVMKGMPDECVDLVVTSPPYNQLGKGRNRQKGWSTSKGMFYGNGWREQLDSIYDDDIPEDEYQEWLGTVLSECMRIAKGLVWINHKMRYRNGVGIHPLSFLRFPVWSEVVWSRNGSMALNCKRFAPSHELIYGFGRPHYWNDVSNRLLSVWAIAASTGDGHPCSFPIRIPERLIEASCPPGGTICDPFMGSGSTAVACIYSDRHYIGIELEQKYVDIANERIQQEQAQLKFAF